MKTISGYTTAEPEEFRIDWFPICSIEVHDKCAELLREKCIYRNIEKKDCKLVSITVKYTTEA